MDNLFWIIVILVVLATFLIPCEEGMDAKVSRRLSKLEAVKAGGTCNCCTCGKISCAKCKRDMKKCCAGGGSVTTDIKQTI